MSTYDQRALGEADRQGRLRLLASRDGRGGSVTIHQDVTVYDARLATGDEASYGLAGDRRAWIQMIEDAVFMLFDLA